MSTADRLRSASLLAGCSGVVVFLALLVSGPQDLPEGATGDEVRRYLEGNLNGIGWLVFAQAVAFGALLLFVVGLRLLMRAGEEPGRLLSDLAAVGGLLTAASFALKASLDMVPLVMADDYGKLTPYDDRTLRALDLLNRLGETVGDVATVPRGLLVLAVSLLALRSRFLPTWLAYLGLVVAAASLVGTVSLGWDLGFFSAAGLVGLFGFAGWVLAVSIVLLVWFRWPSGPR